MAWEVVRVERRTVKGKANARVAAGTLHISKTAMALLGDMSTRRNAELMYDLEDGRVGVRFLEEPSPLSISVRDERDHGKRPFAASWRDMSYMCAISRQQLVHKGDIAPRNPEILALSIAR